MGSSPIVDDVRVAPRAPSRESVWGYPLWTNSPPAQRESGGSQEGSQAPKTGIWSSWIAPCAGETARADTMPKVAGTMDLEPIYCAEQIQVPPELAGILKAYTKEVVRRQPEDICRFSAITSATSRACPRAREKRRCRPRRRS